MIMCEIKTLVYCDLEATGLKNSGRPRITELSLVAVNTESILDLNVVLLSHLQKNNINVERIFPRVLNKLTICVYPMATIRTEVSEITGLDNYNLSGQATFDKETGELLNSFLERLPKQLCLVAHNGDSYDFPLLKAELEKVKVIYYLMKPCVLILMLV
jgi:three prime repair exonuclease-1